MSEKVIKILLTVAGFVVLILLNGLFWRKGSDNGANPIFSMLLVPYLIGVWRWKKKDK